MGKANGQTVATDKDPRSTVQEKMLEVLSDGLPHTRDELFACLYEQDAPIRNIGPHLAALRKKLASQGQTIVCEQLSDARGLMTRRAYRHVRLLVSAVDGRR